MANWFAGLSAFGAVLYGIYRAATSSTKPATPATGSELDSPKPSTPPSAMPEFDAFGVEFARGSTDVIWPLPGDRHSNSSTAWARGRVSSDFGDARPFGAKSPTRHHAGEDLRAPRGSVLVATEPGRIIGIDEDWYESKSGVMTGSVLVACDSGIVVNFGEVEPGSTRALGLNVGSTVARGQALARVGATNMVHFETYREGTTRTHRWAWTGAPPPELLDPTRYLERASVTVP